MSDDLLLVENFNQMKYLGGFNLVEDELFTKIELDVVNARAIAVFMICFVLISTLIAYFVGGTKEMTFVLAGGTMAGSMFVGMMYLLAADSQNQVLPYINRQLSQLVLASGTTIPQQKILCFRQYQCKTKISNFRLVLTTVVVQASDDTLEYAVVPTIGKFSDDRIGREFADFFETQLQQDSERRFTPEELASLGLS